jgi:hypothetical protein
MSNARSGPPTRILATLPTDTTFAGWIRTLSPWRPGSLRRSRRASKRPSGANLAHFDSRAEPDSSSGSARVFLRRELIVVAMSAGATHPTPLAVTPSRSPPVLLYADPN